MDEAKVTTINSECILRINGLVYVSKVGDWVRLILKEAHYAKYSIYPSVAKMYHYLKQHH